MGNSSKFTRVMRAGITLVLGAWMVTAAAPVWAQVGITVFGEGAAKGAEEIERQLRAAGVRLTDDDVNNIKDMEATRKEISRLYGELNRYQAAYQGEKNEARDMEIRKQKIHLRTIYNDLPKPDASVGGYYLDMQRYQSQSGKKQHAAHIKAINDSLATYKSEVSGAKLAAGAAAARPARRFIVDIISTSGDMEFFINGSKVERARQTFTLDMDSFTLRAMALGKRRKLIRNFQYNPATTTVDAKEDFRLKYSVASGEFAGSTEWKVEDETYRWNVTRDPGFKTPWEAQDDAVAFSFGNSFTFGASVEGEAKWVGDSRRSGRTQVLRDSDKATGSIMFTVRPAE